MAMYLKLVAGWKGVVGIFLLSGPGVTKARTEMFACHAVLIAEFIICKELLMDSFYFGPISHEGQIVSSYTTKTLN